MIVTNHTSPQSFWRRCRIFNKAADWTTWAQLHAPHKSLCDICRGSLHIRQQGAAQTKTVREGKRHLIAAEFPAQRQPRSAQSVGITRKPGSRQETTCSLDYRRRRTRVDGENGGEGGYGRSWHTHAGAEILPLRRAFALTFFRDGLGPCSIAQPQRLIPVEVSRTPSLLGPINTEASVHGLAPAAAFAKALMNADRSKVAAGSPLLNRPTMKRSSSSRQNINVWKP